MASVTGTATATNTSGSYQMIIYPCGSGTSIVDQQFTATTNGGISHTITSGLLDGNLGSIKVQIRDFVNQSILGESSCFNHNCSVGSSITGVSGSSTC